MADPVLLVETPRAQSTQHRFLTSRATLSSGEAAAFLDNVRRGTPTLLEGDIYLITGANFLAVQRRVVQRQTQRLGLEILILLGINVPKLKDDQRQSVIDCLAQRLRDLEKILLDERWPSDIMVVSHPVLSKWVQEYFSTLPTHVEQSVALNEATSFPWWFRLILMVGWSLVVYLVLATIFSW